METKYFQLVHKLNEDFKQLLIQNEVHFRASLNSFSLISVSKEKPELGIQCKKGNYKLEKDFQASILADITEIKNKPDSILSKPEKKLQAWIIKNALQNNLKLPFDNDIRFITSELAILNKAGKKIVTDILGYSESKKKLCVIELKSDRLLKRLIEQVNNFEYVIKENHVFFSELLSIYDIPNPDGAIKEVIKIIVWKDGKTSPREELRAANIREVTYYDEYAFNKY